MSLLSGQTANRFNWLTLVAWECPEIGGMMTKAI
jgi:hypothetical protein